jgi:hypothetical protein
LTVLANLKQRSAREGEIPLIIRSRPVAARSSSLCSNA